MLWKPHATAQCVKAHATRGEKLREIINQTAAPFFAEGRDRLAQLALGLLTLLFPAIPALDLPVFPSLALLSDPVLP